MATNGHLDMDADPAIAEAFSKLSELERDFAAVELDARKSSTADRSMVINQDNSCLKAVDKNWAAIILTSLASASEGILIARTILEAQRTYLDHPIFLVRDPNLRFRPR